METIILLLAGLLALTIIFFKVKKITNLLQDKSGVSSCSCDTCSGSCYIKKKPATVNIKSDDITPDLLHEHRNKDKFK